MTEPAAPLPEQLEQGLAAAFRARREPHEPREPRGAGSPSVLERLGAQSGRRLDVDLPPAAGEGSDPMVRVEPREDGAPPPGSARYQVSGELARGGVGIVYRGRDRDLGRDVALKVLNERYAGDPELLARFVEEAQIAGQLQHPGIVPVYELGLQHDRRPFFAMKLVRGETLRALLRRRRAPSDDLRRFLVIFEQVCQTVAYAHARGVVHRDLKPSNVMVGAFGEVQVVDWGLAKILGRGGLADEARAPVGADATVVSTSRSRSGTQSLAGSVMGTPAYMPPEQARGEVEAMDERSDVFALGAMLCELLSGEPPYPGGQDEALRQARECRTGPCLERLRQLEVDVPLVALVEDCLRAAPGVRPHDAGEVARRVADHQAALEQRAREAELRSARAEVRARVVAGLAAAAVALVLGGAGGGLWWQSARAAQRRAVASEVASALEQARALEGSAEALLAADGASELGLARYAEAVAAAQGGAALALRGDAATLDEARGVRASLSEALAAARARAAALRRDRALAEALLLVRVPDGAHVNVPDFQAQDVTRMDRDYGATFQAFGVDVDALPPEEAARRLRGSADLAVAAALADWSRQRRQLLEAERAGLAPTGAWERPLAAARALDGLDPWRSRLYTALAREPLSVGELLALRREAGSADVGAQGFMLLGEALCWEGAVREGLEALAAGLARHPRDFALSFGLGLRHDLQGDVAQAARHYAAARALRPDIVQVAHQLADVLARVDPDSARALFGELSAAEPGRGHWRWHLGFLAEQGGDWDTARREYERAVELEPELAEGWYELARACEAQADLAEAERCYQQALALAPRHARALNNLANLLIDRGLAPEAEALYRRAVESEPTLAAPHHNLGDLLRAAHRHEEAIASYRAGLALAPEHPGVHDGLARSLYFTGRFPEALASARRARALGGWHGQPTDTWIAWVERAVALAPRLPDLLEGRADSDDGFDWVVAADLLYGQGRYGAAVELYERAWTRSQALGDPRLDGIRSHAAGAAALAAAGRGADAPQDEAGRAELRERALYWLQSDLLVWLELVDGPERPAARAALGELLQHADLASVRAPEALAALPEEERAAWEQLWADARAALAGGR